MLHLEKNGKWQADNQKTCNNVDDRSDKPDCSDVNAYTWNSSVPRLCDWSTLKGNSDENCKVIGSDKEAGGIVDDAAITDYLRICFLEKMMIDEAEGKFCHHGSYFEEDLIQP